MKQVQARTSGSQDAFQNLNNKWGSDWETATAPKFPLDINIIGADGESVSPLGRQLTRCVWRMPSSSVCREWYWYLAR